MSAYILNPVLTPFGSVGTPPVGGPPYSVLGDRAPLFADRATGFIGSGSGNITVKLKVPRADGSTDLSLILSQSRPGAPVEFTEITSADDAVWPIIVEYFGHGLIAISGCNAAAGNIGARLIERGTFVLANNTTEQTVIELLASSFGGSGQFQVELDVTALTKNNARVRVYLKPDGVTYAALRDVLVLNATDSAVAYPMIGVASDVKVTLQSQTSEGAARSIPYVAMVF